ncbi:glycosyltransferase family 2 protein [Geomonas sp. RF6]|uniref:glycosyltransferase family 2 protein n=1 Tax=Geomonas sp. RF6 TaxID=2897342 RepID=UPI001E38DF91|nr:glycosyltransferase family 2 protein [Geomonas sp. RF6]UFS71055.1 glycosyltransferase family 2 protein [Geomonas sp. RF6]
MHRGAEVASSKHKTLEDDKRVLHLALPKRRPRVAVLIPCYNEEKTIAKVVGDFRLLLPEAEIYVFDNNSADRSADLAALAGAVVVRERRQGKGFVVRSMFRNVDADVYLMVDADDTYEAADIVALAGPVLDGSADMVIGDRLSSTYFEENQRALHGAGNRLVRRLINTIFRANLTDIMTGGRAFSPIFVQTYPVMCGGFEIETEMTVHALDKGFMVAEMPVRYRDRQAGSVSKLKTIPDGTRVLKTVMALFKDFRPLLFSSIISAVFLAVAIALFISPLHEYLTTGFVRKVPSIIVSMACGMCSLLALFAGAIMDSIRKQSRMLYELELHRWSQEREARTHLESPGLRGRC